MINRSQGFGPVNHGVCVGPKFARRHLGAQSFAVAIDLVGVSSQLLAVKNPMLMRPPQVGVDGTGPKDPSPVFAFPRWVKNTIAAVGIPSPRVGFSSTGPKVP